MGLAATQPTAELSRALGFPSSLPHDKEPVSPTAVDLEQGASELSVQGLQLQSSPSDGGALDPQTLKPLHGGGDPSLVGPQTCVDPRNILVATTWC